MAVCTGLQPGQLHEKADFARVSETEAGPYSSHTPRDCKQSTDWFLPAGLSARGPVCKHSANVLAAPRNTSGELAVQGVPGQGVGCREDMPVGVDRRLDARVAQAGLNRAPVAQGDD